MLTHQQLCILIDILMNSQGMTKKQAEEILLEYQRKLAEDKIMQSVFRALDTFSR